ncbi:hypothetical protein KIN20_006875, partial [Parelaphostrongylus tenuis]
MTFQSAKQFRPTIHHSEKANKGSEFPTTGSTSPAPGWENLHNKQHVYSSMSEGSRRQQVFDGFDGEFNPWLGDEDDLVFVPNAYKHPKQHPHSRSESEEESDVFSPVDDSRADEDKAGSDVRPEFVSDDVYTNMDTEYPDQSTERSVHNFKSPGIVCNRILPSRFCILSIGGVSLLAACPVGDLFDIVTKKCVTSTSCGQTGSIINSDQQVPPPTISTLVQHTTPLKVEPGCMEKSDFAMDCNGNFMKCVNGHFYPMKCPKGLVFDQLIRMCNFARDVPACRAQSTMSKRHMNEPTDRTSTGDPVFPAVNETLVDMNVTVNSTAISYPDIAIVSETVANYSVVEISGIDI